MRAIACRKRYHPKVDDGKMFWMALPYTIGMSIVGLILADYLMASYDASELMHIMESSHPN